MVMPAELQNLTRVFQCRKVNLCVYVAFPVRVCCAARHFLVQNSFEVTTFNLSTAVVKRRFVIICPDLVINVVIIPVEVSNLTICCEFLTARFVEFASRPGILVSVR